MATSPQLTKVDGAKVARFDQDEAAYQAWPMEEHKRVVRTEQGAVVELMDEHEKRDPRDQDEAAYQAWPMEEHK